MYGDGELTRFPQARLDELLAVSAARHPDRPAIVTPSVTLGFAELEADVARWASAVRAMVGVGSRAVVALHAALDPQLAIAYYGTIRAGHVVAMLNPLLPAPVVVQQLARVRARVAVVTAQVAVTLTSLLDRASDLQLVVLDGDGPAPGMRGLLAGACPAPTEPITAKDWDEVAAIQFTSGTTGRPKAVQLSHRNITVNAIQVARAHELSESAIAANHLPTYHPMHLNSAIVAGATQVLCTMPDPIDSVAFAAEHGVTHYYSLPVRLSHLAEDVRLGEPAVPTLRVIASGGSSLPRSSAATLRARFGVPVIQGYGLAETAPLTHSDVLSRPKPGSVGPPVADTECRVVDLDTRRVAAVGEVGEVQLRGPQLMLGYLDDADSGIDPDGWLSTGDIGRVDADGYLFLVDRIKDVFKCDNWLVSPSSVEQAVCEQPEIAACCVVDVPDRFSGAVAHALVVPDPGDLPPERVRASIAEANERLPYYERIRDFLVVPSIPRSANGKISRSELRDRFFTRQRDVPLREKGATMVTLVNKFVVSGDPSEFEKIWQASSDFMRQQPGFVSFRLVRSLTDPTVYINIAQWEDAESHRRVMSGPDFKSHIAELAKVAKPEPHLCQVVIEYGV
ncbi:AMP-binding protein [Planosporangium thailandense]|uniref:AMP-binding protein n=1 Tax=Planosporangium thailandense TaxID=765197 RepID=A0ABX0XXP7_9ACTN|nr:AMP-binding protein [Planosporangium thailandense]